MLYIKAFFVNYILHTNVVNSYRNVPVFDILF